jgi:hypothetical protein
MKEEERLFWGDVITKEHRKKTLQDIFSYHNPSAEEQVIYEEVNRRFLELVKWVDEQIDFKSESGKNALRKLADARMAVNSAIALKDKY